MGLFDLFKRKTEPSEPYSRMQFHEKYRAYSSQIIEDWAKRNHPNLNAPSIVE